MDIFSGETVLTAPDKVMYVAGTNTEFMEDRKRHVLCRRGP